MPQIVRMDRLWYYIKNKSGELFVRERSEFYSKFKFFITVNRDISIRKKQLFDFVILHKIDCYRAFKNSINHTGYKTPEGLLLIKKVREWIPYSNKTWDGDIYIRLWKLYTEIVGKEED